MKKPPPHNPFLDPTYNAEHERQRKRDLARLEEIERLRVEHEKEVRRKEQV